eukprot:s8886_g4.t1
MRELVRAERSALLKGLHEASANSFLHRAEKGPWNAYMDRRFYNFQKPHAQAREKRDFWWSSLWQFQNHLENLLVVTSLTGAKKIKGFSR